MRKAFILLALLATSTLPHHVSIAQPPEPLPTPTQAFEINGGADLIKAAPGDLVVMTCNAPDGAGVVWILGNSDKTFLAVEDSRKCVFASGKSGVYNFFAVTATGTTQSVDRIKVQIGDDVTPPDDDDDDPDTPPDNQDLPDDFDNLASKVQSWSKGLPKRKEVGEVYLDTARKLANGEHLSINDAAQSLVENRRTVLGDDGAKWKSFGEKLTQDFSDRWDEAPMTRGVVAVYWKTVAAGLGVDNG